MRILHLTDKDYKTSQWSGGTTTELLIWPEGADYAKREFQVRISSATVELAESDFTPLQGVMRYITPLSGGFTLTHPGCEPVVMGPMDAPYRFSGETTTHCVGVATDFNLMLKGVEGEMRCAAGKLVCAQGMVAIFAPEARTITVQAEKYALAAGELLVVFTEAVSTLIDLGQENSLVCHAKI